MKRTGVLLSMCLSASAAFAVDYSSIDVGDVYYINKFGSNNDMVVVERKLGDGMVKVRYDDYSTAVKSASSLMTREKLKETETTNTLGGMAIGGAILYCLFSNDCN